MFLLKGQPQYTTRQKLSVTGTGRAHQEATWRGTFPSGWVWAEGTTSDGESQLVLSAGQFDIAGITTEQAIVTIRSPTTDEPRTHTRIKQRMCHASRT